MDILMVLGGWNVLGWYRFVWESLSLSPWVHSWSRPKGDCREGTREKKRWIYRTLHQTPGEKQPLSNLHDHSMAVTEGTSRCLCTYSEGMQQADLESWKAPDTSKCLARKKTTIWYGNQISVSQSHGCKQCSDTVPSSSWWAEEIWEEKSTQPNRKKRQAASTKFISNFSYLKNRCWY